MSHFQPFFHHLLHFVEKKKYKTRIRIRIVFTYSSRFIIDAVSRYQINVIVFYCRLSVYIFSFYLFVCQNTRHLSICMSVSFFLFCQLIHLWTVYPCLSLLNSGCILYIPVEYQCALLEDGTPARILGLGHLSFIKIFQS